VNVTRTDITTRRTRKGAEAYATGLFGVPAGEWLDDHCWNGQRQVPIRLRFAVEQRGPREFVVVREVEVVE
jgi:hypothetical protein